MTNGTTFKKSMLEIIIIIVILNSCNDYVINTVIAKENVTGLCLGYTVHYQYFLCAVVLILLFPLVYIVTIIYIFSCLFFPLNFFSLVYFVPIV